MGRVKATKHFQNIVSLTAEIAGNQLRLRWREKPFMSVNLKQLGRQDILESELRKLSADVHDGVMKLLWDGRALLALSLNNFSHVLADLATLKPGEEMDEELGGENAVKMAKAYAEVRRKYSGINYTIRPNNKYWKFIVEAAAQADELGVDYYEWCEAITNELTRMNPEETIRVPWPSQLRGEKAATFVSNYVAGSKKSPKASGARRATKMADVPLGEDEEYKAIRLRMKRRKHTLEDVEYVRKRHQQVYGVEKSWVNKFEKTAVDAR